MRILTVAVAFIMISVSVSAFFSQLPDPAIDIIHYEFNLLLNDTTDNIEGRTMIMLVFRDPVSEITFDFKNYDSTGKGMKTASVTFDREDVKWHHEGNMLKIYPGKMASRGDTGIISIDYSGIPADGLIISRNKFGNRTFFSDHWPDRASNYLPVVDHPSDKATVDFIITAPWRYEVVGSGHLIEESDLPGGERLTHWKEDVPLPVKVMAFGAASFATSLAGVVEKIPVWSWVYAENRDAGFNDYAVAVKPLAFYCKLIGPYSFEKLANVQSKTIFGGLENAGCIFYSENSVTGQGRAESLIAHEIAHQWFGNSVTEKDWHHIWLSEGFATYLTSVYLEKTYGVEQLVRSMTAARERVIRYYERNPAPVIDTTVTDLMKLLNANSYQKGAWVLHMLRFEIGEEDFWKGIRLFYERYRYGNALTDDLRQVMEDVSGSDMGWFFHQWLYVAGQPDLKITTGEGNVKGTIIVSIEQMQDYLFTFNLELGLKDSKGIRNEKIRVSDKITRISLKADPDALITIDPEVRLLFRKK